MLFNIHENIWTRRTAPLAGSMYTAPSDWSRNPSGETGNEFYAFDLPV